MSPTAQSVLFVLTILIFADNSTQQSRQQFAWKPQGRFGKRSDQHLAVDVTSPVRDTETRSDETSTDGLRASADRPVIHADGVTCIRILLEGGYYKCIRSNFKDEKLIPDETLYRLFNGGTPQRKQRQRNF